MGEKKKKESLPSGTIVNEFTILRHIGSGGYGDIYKVKNPTNELFALKMEKSNLEHPKLGEELAFMLNLQNSLYFPRVYGDGEYKGNRYIVMELLGPSVSSVRRILPDGKYSAYTLVRVALEMLNCIQEFHLKGYVHRDIKPGNFLVKPSRSNPICLTDFGLSSSYINKKTGKHIAFCKDAGFTGTCRYVSVYTHKGYEISRRDDMFSWFYSVYEMANGKLPWPGSEDRKLTHATKSNILPRDMCAGLPKCFLAIYNSIKKLEFEEEPHYRQYKKLLVEYLRNTNFPSLKYDWESIPPKTFKQISPIPIQLGEIDEISSDIVMVKTNKKCNLI